MKKQWAATITAILTVTTATLLCLMEQPQHSVSARPVLAASQGASSPVSDVPDSLPILPSAYALGIENSASSTAAGGWAFECVDCPKQFWNLTDRSLRLDAAGHPHLAYGRDHLYYAWYDGAQWQYETADDSSGVGEHAALDLDENGYPHVSYVDIPNETLKYAYRDASGWHVQVVDDPIPSFEPEYTSIALDESGHPHISYHNYNLYYAHQDAAGWHIETVDVSMVGRYSSLALDEGGYAHISYYDLDSTDLKHAYQDLTGWHIQTVDSVGTVGTYTSLALDSSSNAHISYCDLDSDDLKYAYQDLTGWHVQTVDSEGYTVAATSLALDESGYAHISYRGDGWVLNYAYQDGSGWYTETVGSAGSVIYTSLALDESGDAHINYYSDGDLEYAYQDPTGWQIQTVDSDGGTVGEFTSLALDESELPHISYFDAEGYGLKYARRGTDGWQFETVVTDLGHRGGYTSLALDTGGLPHISYYDYTETDLMYAYQDAGGWHIERVDGVAYYENGPYNSLALDEAGQPHISYFSASSDYDLKHAYRDASGWHKETVAVLGRVGLFSSLVLDEQGYGHISCWHYSDYTNSSLDYAYQDAGGWHVVAGVDSGQTGRYTSVALDNSGYPHISYHASRSGALWNTLAYAYWNGSGWIKQNVDSGGDEPLGAYTSLALDGDDYPHMSYFDNSNSALKYAYEDGSGWHKQTLDNDGEVGRYTSLALDASGYPHISYHDTSGGDLKYAYYVGPPVAAFAASPTSGPLPLTVVFTDTSTGAVDTRLWSFGDAVTSTLASPTHTYSATGVYTVALTVSGPGGSDSVTQPNAISVRDPIPAQADFTANPTSGTRPLTVVYTNSSSGDYSSSLWDLGDGVTSTLESPTHTYTTAGAYTVTLAVSGLGGSDSITRANFITVTAVPVQAAFSAAPTTGLIPLTVAFTNTSSGDYSTSLWDLGDSVTSTLESPTHVYATTGAYTVSLTVSGPGGSDTEVKVDYIAALDEHIIYLPLILR